MKTRFFFRSRAARWAAIFGLSASCAVISLPAQNPPPAPDQAAQNAPPKLSSEELNQLLAPIALYPDALVALILPASTVPSDVVMAARYLNNNGSEAQIPNQPWDDSVKSLARYPDVLTWMDQNLEWTTSVGEAFVEQPADVMNAVQQLRTQAKAAGNLVDTPQQKVVVEKEVIRIVPAEPEVIYIPQYDPEIVYVQPYTPVVSPLVTFGIGFAVGSWLNYDFDWNRRCVYRGNWRGWNGYNNGWGGWGNGGGGWGNGGGNTVNVVNINNNNATPWQPSAQAYQQVAQRQRNNTGNSRIASANARALRNVNPGNNREFNRSTAPSANANRFAALPRPSRLDANRGGNRRSQNPAANVNTTAASPTAPTSNRPGSEARPGQNWRDQNPAEAGQGRNRDERSNRPRQPRETPSAEATLPPAPAQVSETPRNRPGQGPRTDAPRANRGDSRGPRTPSAPPQVPGQLNPPAPGNSSNSSRNSSRREREVRPSTASPSTPPAPSASRSAAENRDQPRRPSPYVRPSRPPQSSSQDRPQRPSPSHQAGQPTRQPEAPSQPPRPDQSRPQPQKRSEVQRPQPKPQQEIRQQQPRREQPSRLQAQPQQQRRSQPSTPKVDRPASRPERPAPQASRPNKPQQASASQNRSGGGSGSKARKDKDDKKD